VSQVYAICGRFGVKLRAYRDGVGEVAEKVILRTSVVAVKKIKTEKGVRRLMSA